MIAGVTALTMPYGDLFGWWFASITFNILFVVAASVYLYRRRRGPALERPTGWAKVARTVKDFTFVWLLMALFLLYVFAVRQGTLLVPAVGNIALQILLLIYVVSNADRRGR